MISTAAPSAADVLRLSAAQVDGPLRSAVGQLPAPLCLGAGFHFGFWDAAGGPITAAQGKMVRPAFAFAAARAVNGGAVNDTALRAGVAVELVHNFSLVHDDVMDQDRTRRGRPTVWVQFGVPCAILVGDGLLALASQVLTQEGDVGAAAMCAELNSVVVDLCLGQQQDMSFEETLLVSPESYLEMAAGKTSALLAGSCVLGAMAGGGTQRQVSALRRFGHHVGLAFQLVDDVLGIFGDPAVTGKPAGADLLRYKKSMPVLAAMQAGCAASDELTELYRTQAITEARLARAVGLVERAGGRTWTQTEAERQYRLALDCLEEIGGDARAEAELAALANLMINRNR
ncbi:family 2 encapsulin nanocompartment cargo protein polyprenyl transferase [Lentzea roselyniae]|uniref:Family 2 encapsulin nanocompartment cargo protein polyprenyl transferase n=1 Tax=Lentzea roselyniae TaxID=531940 RepID=A0ABP7C5V9_9PSEU